MLASIMPSCPIHASYPLLPLWIISYLDLFGLLWSVLNKPPTCKSHHMLLPPLVEEISPQLLKQASWCLLLPETGSGSLGRDGKDFRRIVEQEEKIPSGRRLGLGVVEGSQGGGGGGGGRRASSPSPCSTASACPAPPASPSSPHSVLPLGGSVEQ